MKKIESIVHSCCRLGYSLSYPLAVLFILAVLLMLPTPDSLAETSPEWIDEFEEICSAVQDGYSLSIEEIQALIERTDKLLPVIKASDEPKKKVYIFRLKKCRNFFEYVIELKKEGR